MITTFYEIAGFVDTARLAEFHQVFCLIERASALRGFENAQVMRGGVPLTAIDPESCEVRGHAGLFVTGELLDMDGNCGGYNLQWAFATGTVCGRAAARREARSKG